MIKMRIQKKTTGGFTIVEMIIYTAFVAVLGVIAIQATILTLKAFYASRITRNINESATVSLERMSREVRNAFNYDTTLSTFNTSPGVLYLNTKDASGNNTTIKFLLSNGTLRVEEGGTDKGPLFSKGVTATSLIFRQATTTNSKAIKVEMTLADTYKAINQTLTLYDTIILRGSAH